MIRAQVTVDDYIAAHRLHHRRRTIIFYAIFAAIALVGVILGASGWKYWLIVMLGGVGGLLGQWWDDRIGLPGKVRKLYAQFKGIEDPGELSWDTEYIEGRSERGQGRRKWTEYARFVENDEVMLLYITDQLWEAFPKRIFDGEQLEQFRKFAQRAGES
jgi:hypothetical protein